MIKMVATFTSSVFSQARLDLGQEYLGLNGSDKESGGPER
jgi:hypothetical protein